MDYDVKKLLPHRDPFLFIDEVLEVDEQSIVAKWFVSPDADFFKGHCDHSFHGSCIIKHVTHNNTDCPICRVNLIKEDTTPINRSNSPVLNISSPIVYELQTPPPIINPILLPPIIPSLQIRPNYIIHQSTQRNLNNEFDETLNNLINSDQTFSYII